MQLALKLIASALQKQPKSQTLRVLKAVALQRSGKDEEGFQVLLLLPMTSEHFFDIVAINAFVGLRDSAP